MTQSLPIPVLLEFMPIITYRLMVRLSPFRKTRLRNALKNGTLQAIVVQNPYFFGYQGVVAAAMSAQGRFAPPSLDPGAVLVDLSNMSAPAVQKLLNPPTTKGGA